MHGGKHLPPNVAPTRGRCPPSSSVPAAALAAPSRAPEEHRDQGRGSTAASTPSFRVHRALSGPAPRPPAPVPQDEFRRQRAGAVRQRPQRPAGDRAAGPDWRCAAGARGTAPGALDAGRPSGLAPRALLVRLLRFSDPSFIQAFLPRVYGEHDSVQVRSHVPGKGDQPCTLAAQ